MNRLTKFSAAALLFLSALTQAGDKQPYDPALFLQLQAQGKVVLIDIYAPWCSTCKKQQKAIKAFLDKYPDKEVHILVVDYDNDKQAVKDFRAPRQSTLLIYRGEQQFWYSVAEFRPEVIESELLKAIQFKAKKRA